MIVMSIIRTYPVKVKEDRATAVKKRRYTHPAHKMNKNSKKSKKLGGYRKTYRPAEDSLADSMKKQMAEA
jgi:hypothetical protein